MIVHYTHPYLLNPVHKITIDLVGLGGTGSLTLTNLGRMNEALTGLGHPGFHVRAWDADEVSAANAGRQMFSPADIGQNKANVLVTRINRFFGYEWQAMPVKYTGSKRSNIIFTCVDSAKARLMIGEKLAAATNDHNTEPVDRSYYWMDVGNLRHTGQCILGTLGPITQPKKTGNTTKAILPTVIKKFPQLKKIKEVDQGPSCSLAEALQKQDLFINSTVSQYACNIIWKLLRDGMIRYSGCYVNLETFNTNPIKI